MRPVNVDKGYKTVWLHGSTHARLKEESERVGIDMQRLASIAVEVGIDTMQDKRRRQPRPE